MAEAFPPSLKQNAHHREFLVRELRKLAAHFPAVRIVARPPDEYRQRHRRHTDLHLYSPRNVRRDGLVDPERAATLRQVDDLAEPAGNPGGGVDDQAHAATEADAFVRSLFVYPLFGPTLPRHRLDRKRTHRRLF